MRILYICDNLITFILNEIIELKEMGNDLYVLVDWRDIWVTSQVITPILTKNGLLDKTFARRRIYKYRKQKLIQLIYKVTYDFIKHPVFTLRGLFYMLKSYPTLKKGTEEYLDLRQLFDSKIDLIHSAFSTPEILDKIYFMSKSMNVPYTLSFRAHDIYKNNVRCEIQKRTEVIQEASHIITISSFNKNTLKTNLQIDKDIDIIHGCINTDLFKPAKESKSNRSIITVCRLDEQKGLIYLLEACYILNRRNIEYDYTIIGEGPEKTRYEKYIDELKIPNVNIVDFMMQDDICKYLNRSTVFVLPCIVSSA